MTGKYLVQIRPHLSNKLVQPVHLFFRKDKEKYKTKSEPWATQLQIMTAKRPRNIRYIHDHNQGFSPKAVFQEVVAEAYQNLAQPVDGYQDPIKIRYCY